MKGQKYKKIAIYAIFILLYIYFPRQIHADETLSNFQEIKTENNSEKSTDTTHDLLIKAEKNKPNNKARSKTTTFTYVGGSILIVILVTGLLWKIKKNKLQKKTKLTHRPSYSSLTEIIEAKRDKALNQDQHP